MTTTTATTKITRKDINWEKRDGETEGYYTDQNGHDWEIWVQGRPTAKDTRWNDTWDTLDWRLSDERNKTVAKGESKDLRAAKTAALAALNAALANA